MTETMQDIDISTARFAFPVQASFLSGQRGMSSYDTLLESARKMAPDPSVFEEHPPFFWRAQISNSSVDAYFTRMAQSSLKNYAADAERGVAFLNSHRTGGMLGNAELPLGRSFAGRYSGPQGTGRAKVEADFYTLSNYHPNGPASIGTDELLLGFRGGALFDVSIGFFGGWARCGECDRAWLDMDCSHWPGVIRREGDEPKTVVVWIEDAHLAETSVVYDGATSGAMLMELKGGRMIEAGLLSAKVAHELTTRYRINLPTVRQVYPSAQPEAADVSISAEERIEPMADETNAPATPTPEPTPEPQPAVAPDRMPEIRAVLTEHGVTAEAADPLAAVRALAVETARLRPLADEGRAYRADLIEQALTEGVRASGTEFARETYAALLASAPLETVKRMRDDWAAQAAKTLKGGRATVDEADPARTNGSASQIPDAAYRG